MRVAIYRTIVLVFAVFAVLGFAVPALLSVKDTLTVWLGVTLLFAAIAVMVEYFVWCVRSLINNANKEIK